LTYIKEIICEVYTNFYKGKLRLKSQFLYLIDCDFEWWQLELTASLFIFNSSY